MKSVALMGFPFAFNFCTHVFFHKFEIHKIKALGFLLEFSKDKSFNFFKGKTHQNLFNQYFRLKLILEFKKTRFTFTLLQCIQVEFNSQKSSVAVTPAFYFT